MIEPRRTATTLRWHAFSATAAIVVAIAAMLGNTPVEVADPAHPLTQYGYRIVRLGIAAPLWLLVAWQLVELRRRTRAGSHAFAVAAFGALVTAAAAIGAELAADAAARPGLEVDWIAAAVLFAWVGIATWMIATCVALGGAAARLAAGTLHLPTVQLRERALHVVTACFLAPWSLLAAFCATFVGHPVLGLATIGAGVLALLTTQLVLADLIARSRELATAAVRE